MPIPIPVRIVIARNHDARNAKEIYDEKIFQDTCDDIVRLTSRNLAAIITFSSSEEATTYLDTLKTLLNVTTPDNRAMCLDNCIWIPKDHLTLGNSQEARDCLEDLILYTKNSYYFTSPSIDKKNAAMILAGFLILDRYDILANLAKHNPTHVKQELDRHFKDAKNVPFTHQEWAALTETNSTLSKHYNNFLNLATKLQSRELTEVSPAKKADNSAAKASAPGKAVNTVGGTYAVLPPHSDRDLQAQMTALGFYAEMNAARLKALTPSAPPVSAVAGPAVPAKRT